MNFLRNPKPYIHVLRNSFIADMEYRSNYYILILSSFITVVMEMAIFKQVYSVRETAGDLHRSQALSFVVLGMLLRSGVLLWTMIADSIEQIRDGSFRKFLLQPIDYPSYFHAQVIGPKITTWVLAIITLVVCKQVSGFEALLPSGSVGPFILAVILAYALTWQIYLGLIYIAFWVEEASFLSTAFNIGLGLFTGTLVPLSWFPDTLVRILNFTPFPLIGNFPLNTGLGILTGKAFQQSLVACLLWLIAVMAFNKILQKAAFKRFEAFGG